MMKTKISGILAATALVGVLAVPAMASPNSNTSVIESANSNTSLNQKVNVTESQKQAFKESMKAAGSLKEKTLKDIDSGNLLVDDQAVAEYLQDPKGYTDAHKPVDGANKIKDTGGKASAYFQVDGK
ncbi:hypothetical protein [Bacillus sp. 1P06AnD]|uniref:hypothetical protein n=1 Tax=Bacillus sp. 1P06AnD TaxID=3132208 RepID=UPI00399FB87A